MDERRSEVCVPYVVVLQDLELFCVLMHAEIKRESSSYLTLANA
jgi:hypothetical protein